MFEHTIDRDDVGHGKECGQPRAELCEEVASLALLGLRHLLTSISNAM